MLLSSGLIKMSMAQYLWLSAPHLQFFCRQCCGATDGYNFAASLTRIGAVSPDVAAMRGKADSELNLLQFYDICLPRLVSLSSKEISIHKPLLDMLR